MRRSHIIATAALVLAVAGFATSRHFRTTLLILCPEKDISQRHPLLSKMTRCLKNMAT